MFLNEIPEVEKDGKTKTTPKNLDYEEKRERKKKTKKKTADKNLLDWNSAPAVVESRHKSFATYCSKLQGKRPYKDSDFTMATVTTHVKFPLSYTDGRHGLRYTKRFLQKQ